jgi:hypothetical protein
MADLDRIKEENRNIRLLRISSDLVIQMFMTRPVSRGEADAMIRGVKKLALRLFPGKESVFDLIYLPRFKRALEEAGMRDLPEVLTILERRKQGGPIHLRLEDER